MSGIPPTEPGKAEVDTARVLFHEQIRRALQAGVPLSLPQMGLESRTVGVPKLSKLDFLKQNYDHVIGMDQQITVPKGESIATYGLSGCIAGCIEGPDKNIFFHYSPLNKDRITSLVKEHASSDAIWVRFFVPEEHVQDAAGQWVSKPESLYITDFLSGSIAHLKGGDVPIIFHCYSSGIQLGLAESNCVSIGADGVVYVAGFLDAGMPYDESMSIAAPILPPKTHAQELLADNLRSIQVEGTDDSKTLYICKGMGTAVKITSQQEGIAFLEEAMGLSFQELQDNKAAQKPIIIDVMNALDEHFK